MDKNSSFARLDDLPRFIDARAVFSWVQRPMSVVLSLAWQRICLVTWLLGADISGDDLLTIIEISGRTFLSPKSSQLRQGCSPSIDKHVLTGIKIRLGRRNQHVPSHRLGATGHRQ
jgi:hypothetical protein